MVRWDEDDENADEDTISLLTLFMDEGDRKKESNKVVDLIGRKSKQGKIDAWVRK